MEEEKHNDQDDDYTVMYVVADGTYLRSKAEQNLQWEEQEHC